MDEWISSILQYHDRLSCCLFPIRCQGLRCSYLFDDWTIGLRFEHEFTYTFVLGWRMISWNQILSVEVFVISSPYMWNTPTQWIINDCLPRCISNAHTLQRYHSHIFNWIYLIARWLDKDRTRSSGSAVSAYRGPLALKAWHSVWHKSPRTRTRRLQSLQLPDFSTANRPFPAPLARWPHSIIE